MRVYEKSTIMINLLCAIMFLLSEIMFIDALSNDLNIPGIPGVPDPRKLKTKISRGSGMGYISFGFGVVVVLAFALFVGAFWLVMAYKRKEQLKESGKKLYISQY